MDALTQSRLRMVRRQIVSDQQQTARLLEDLKTEVWRANAEGRVEGLAFVLSILDGMFPDLDKRPNEDAGSS